jgi:hypothetical protein
MKRKMMLFVAILLLFVAILLSFLLSVTASSDYPRIGGYDSDFVTERSIFSENLDPLTLPLTIRSFGDLKQTPLVADMNNDNLNEIIVVSDDDLYIYQGSELIFVDSYDIGTEEPYSNFEMFDIDMDGFLEVIIGFETSEKIDYFGFN